MFFLWLFFLIDFVVQLLEHGWKKFGLVWWMMIETFYDYYTDTVFTDNRMDIKDIFKEINQMVLVGLQKNQN